MLTSIRIANFKSYSGATLPLAALTFLIGANAAGKSNLLEAMRLLHWLGKGSRLEDIARAIESGDALVRGQSVDLFRESASPFTLGLHWSDSPDGWADFEVAISLLDDQLVITGEKVTQPSEKVPLYAVDGTPNPHTDEIGVAYNNFRRGPIKPHIPCSNRQAIFFQLETPGRFEAAHAESQRIIPRVARSLRETLREIVFLDPRPSLMRDYAYAKDDAIKEDGSNLSAVLYKIANAEQDTAQLLDFIRSLPEQDITDIKFIKTDRNDVMVRLVESFGDQQRTMDAPLLSDGTLRVLAVGAALLTAPKGALVIIEEIDNGVHPSRAEVLVRQIRGIASARGLRVLLTSHNPALLDALPDEALGDVVCSYRDPEKGDSRLVRLGDLDRYPELVAQGPLGQLMTQRVLDRFVKDDSTPEQRQADALEWLTRLRQEGRGG
ncbi:AAA family ATPase [Marichromatium gracile]|uniref:ATPase n=1 Tax=Marichromatium gracile TaxID=1048 RepID=A0ABR5VKQ9_MARGR|nr:ATP-binding protein [Marichromatium gracile]KXX66264.1 ATPase [Marichromatium gracile]